MKKIGIDARLWNESGVGRYIRSLVNGIDDRKTEDEYTIFLTKDTYNSINFKNPKITKKGADIRWHTISEQWKMKKLLEGEKLDLVHFPYFSYPVFYNRPFVITIHDLIIDNFPTGVASSLPYPLYKLKHFGYKNIVKKAVSNSKKIIVPSNATAEDLIAAYKVNKNKIKVIYEGFDPLISGSKNAKKLVSKNYILYVGNAYPHKNLQKLFEAFSALRKMLDIDLVCIGRNDFFYERLKKNKTQGIFFLHDVDDSALFDYYTNARLFVMPSLMEGFGLPLLEAMNLSCPVIASDTKALKEIGGDACLYFDPYDSSEIAKAAKKVLVDENEREKLIKNGKIQSKKYSWDKCIDETLRVYESCNSV